MLPFDFDYYQPETIQEAVELFQYLRQQGQKMYIYSGGTELITLGRIGVVYADAVIDIKGIPEFHILQLRENRLILGSALTLTEIEEANRFPLLTSTASEIADHTAREKITLGGNICAQIYYREAVLPFLLADSLTVLAGPDGARTVPINQIFRQSLRLDQGEMLVQLITEIDAINAPFISIKRRQQWKTGYPLITVAALKKNGAIRVAVSGLCPFPFRSPEIEGILNNRRLPLEERLSAVLEKIPGPVLDDVEGSAEFRIFVLKNLLSDVCTALQ